MYFLSGPFHLHGHSGDNISPRIEIITLSFIMAQQPTVGQGLLRASRSHSGTPHSGRPVSEISLPDITTLAADNRPYFRRDSNPQSQQATGGRRTSQTARPRGPALIAL